MHPFCLEASQIDALWGDFAVILHRFERTCENLTAEQIVSAVRQGKQQLWGVQDDMRVHGILITEVQQTAKGLVCVLVGACGSAPESEKRALLAMVEDWARSLGCVALKILGRKGWARWDRRFKVTGMILEAPL